MIWADRQQQQLLRCRLMSSTATGSPLPCFAVWKPRFPLPVSFSSLKPATRAEVSKKTRDKGAAAVALAASLCAVLVPCGGAGCESSRASRILSPGRRAICSEAIGSGSSTAERSAKIAGYPRSQGVSKVCQLSRCPWFCSASSSICSHSGTTISASCGGSIRLGLIVFREFIPPIYHEVEIHESGAFERG